MILQEGGELQREGALVIEDQYCVEYNYSNEIKNKNMCSESFRHKSVFDDFW